MQADELARLDYHEPTADRSVNLYISSKSGAKHKMWQDILDGYTKGYVRGNQLEKITTSMRVGVGATLELLVSRGVCSNREPAAIVELQDWLLGFLRRGLL